MWYSWQRALAAAPELLHVLGCSLELLVGLACILSSLLPAPRCDAAWLRSSVGTVPEADLGTSQQGWHRLWVIPVMLAASGRCCPFVLCLVVT